MLKGKPVFHYNMLILAQYHWEGPDVLTPGKHTIGFDYSYDGPGIAKGGSGELKVDGKVVAPASRPTRSRSCRWPTRLCLSDAAGDNLASTFNSPLPPLAMPGPS